MITKIGFSNKMNDIFLRYGIFLFLWNNISMNIFLVLNGIRGMFLKSFDLRGENGTKDIDAGL